MTPAPGDIHAALGRISASRAFASSDRACRLLAYLVERTLEGQGDTIKESVVGREVFDRPEAYDPRLDSIVRVEMRRLRTRLDAYYAVDGARDPIVIAIPKGGYRPLFSERPADPVPPVVPSTTRRTALAGAAVVVGLVLAGWFIWPLVAPPSPGRQVSVAVLPFSVFSTDESDRLLAARLTDGVTTELATFLALSVASRASADRYDTGASIPAVARALGVDLVMEGSIVVDGRVRVTARLVDPRSDRKVWVGQYEVDPSELTALERRIAMEAAPACLANVPRRRP
ncbi:MAG TPA: hypothetical protein VMM93_11870 [Vicinamibacterales bacterium]|nr:hypothetical protein [Vicinamibacterales bacterium]